MGHYDQQNRPKRKATVEIQNIGNGSPKILQQENDFNALENNSCSSTSAAIVPENCGLDNNDYINELKKTKYFESFPPGYRFCPEDSELIVHYLNKKVRLNKLPPNKIQEVVLYNYNPEELIANHPIQGEKETEWFFFTPRDRKYKNGTRPNRAAGDGYWKATGADKPIIENGITIGFRKALVFYKGKPPNGEKTNWIMHEFRLNEPPRTKSASNVMRLDDCVLCRVYYKEEKAKTTQPTNENQVLAEEGHCDYNGVMGYSNGLMNTYDYNGLLHLQNGPSQEFTPFGSPPITSTNSSSEPYQPRSTSSNYEALPILSHRPPPFGAPPITPRILTAQPFQPVSPNYVVLPMKREFRPSEKFVRSEFMKEDPRELPVDFWSNVDFEDFDFDSELGFLNTNYMQNLDSIFSNDTPKQPPK